MRTKRPESTKLHIPLPEDEAIRLALRVKPTKDMPRPGAQKSAPKKRAKKKRSK